MSMRLYEDISHLCDMEDAMLETTLRSYIERAKVSKIRQDSARHRKFRQRKSWSRFQYNLSDRQFRRYFRMSRECFECLCEKIKNNAGEQDFKSEIFLSLCRSGDAGGCPRATPFLRAHEVMTGGLISGEIKMALTLRILAGGSYLDLSLLFEIGSSYAYQILHEVVKNWILDDRIVKINGLDYVSDETMMEAVALQFAQRSSGVINGCIGALDGWIVKTKRPTKNRDGVVNPGSFRSRKGYFGINVQTISSQKKKILFRDISSRGAEHDSTAFKNSPLYQKKQVLFLFLFLFPFLSLFLFLFLFLFRSHPFPPAHPYSCTNGLADSTSRPTYLPTAVSFDASDLTLY